MKIYNFFFISTLIFSTSVIADPDYQLCQNHKKDYEYFKSEFKKEHDKICKNGCSYTLSMIKNSDTMYRIAGTYYLMNCDSSNGRLN
jgi:hypothetical protein